MRRGILATKHGRSHVKAAPVSNKPHGWVGGLFSDDPPPLPYVRVEAVDTPCVIRYNENHSITPVTRVLWSFFVTSYFRCFTTAQVQIMLIFKVILCIRLYSSIMLYDQESKWYFPGLVCDPIGWETWKLYGSFHETCSVVSYPVDVQLTLAMLNSMKMFGKILVL